MSDLFHEGVPDVFIRQAFEVIKQTPQHTYQILTKRADRLSKFFQSFEAPKNAWLGVSVENREDGLPRIDELRNIPAHIRFLSVEPLLEDLGKINLHGIHWVIVGGESGPKARPMKQEWAINVQHCVFQSKPATHSTGSLPPIPFESCHPFQANLPPTEGVTI